MKKLLFIILASAFSAACGAGAILPTGATTAAEPKPKTGETVAFKVSREGFGEGTIEGAAGAQYVIKYGDSTVTKEESDVYVLPTANPNAAIKAGDMVAAKIESGGKYWAGAEVLSANGAVIEVRDLSRDKTASLSPDKVIVVRPAAAAELQKLKAETDFKKKAQAARPAAPAGWKPKPGERVVAEWSVNSWWGGTIAAVAGEKVTVKWSGSFKDSEYGLDRVVPYPKPDASATMPSANSYVLVKPDSDAGQWHYAQITAVNGDSAEIKFPDNKTRSVKTEDFIQLN